MLGPGHRAWLFTRAASGREELYFGHFLGEGTEAPGGGRGLGGELVRAGIRTHVWARDSSSWTFAAKTTKRKSSFILNRKEEAH